MQINADFLENTFKNIFGQELVVYRSADRHGYAVKLAPSIEMFVPATNCYAYESFIAKLTEILSVIRPTHECESLRNDRDFYKQNYTSLTAAIKTDVWSRKRIIWPKSSTMNNKKRRKNR